MDTAFRVSADQHQMLSGTVCKARNTQPSNEAERTGLCLRRSNDLVKKNYPLLSP
jgi:hypothetical protein